MLSVLMAGVLVCPDHLRTSMMARLASALEQSSLQCPMHAGGISIAPGRQTDGVSPVSAVLFTEVDAFYIGGSSEPIYAPARAGHVPAFWPKLAPPPYKNAGQCIADDRHTLSSIAPFFWPPGPLVKWLVDPWLGIVSPIFCLCPRLSFSGLAPQRSRNMEAARGARRACLVRSIALFCLVALIVFCILLARSPCALLPVEWLVFCWLMPAGWPMYAGQERRYGAVLLDAAMRERWKEGNVLWAFQMSACLSTVVNVCNQASEWLSGLAAACPIILCPS